MAVFASKQIVMPVLPIAVTITGSGNSTSCYAIINGAKQYSAGTHEVNSGDTITFGVLGWVKIDGTQVLETTGQSTETYDWTVPSGISAIEIAMELIPFSHSTITVTTA